MFFTADTHFRHANIIRFCNRPFVDIDEMNEAIIKSWNDTVSKNDTIYHLGDFALGKNGDVRKIIQRLNGKIYLCKGSHEKSAEANRDLFVAIKDNYSIKVFVEGKEQHIFLSHYLHKVWPKSHYSAWHLYGHSHSRMDKYARKEGKLLDVGVDGHDFKPWSLKEVVEVMNTRPPNFNDLKIVSK